MKSIVFLLFMLVISIVAYINQDDVVDFLVGPKKGQELIIEDKQAMYGNEYREEKAEDEADNYLDFQDSRSLDDDFNINPKDENLKDSDIEDSNSRDNQIIENILGFTSYESNKLKLTTYEKFGFEEVESSLIKILSEDIQVGEITIIEDVKEAKINGYFKNQSFNLIQDANKQGVYPESFDQSFFEESIKLAGFKGLKKFDYYLMKKDSQILIFKLESSSNLENFEKVIISSARLK